MMSEHSDDVGLDMPVEVATAQNYRDFANAVLQNDRRSSERIELNLLARCMLADRTELPALMVDISSSGLALQCAKRGSVGEPVIIYVDYLGRFEGRITRLLPSGFAVGLRMSRYRRETLIAMLHELTDASLLTPSGHRASAKIRLAACGRIAIAKPVKTGAV